jgi:hypothetical protein
MPVIALGGLAVVMIALMALLLLLASPPVQRLLSATLSRIPLVGGAVDGWINDAINGMLSWLASIVGDMDAWIASLYYPLQVLMNLSHDIAVDVSNQLHNIVKGFVPQQLAALWSQTWGFIQSLASDIAITGNQVRAYAYDLTLGALNDIATTGNQVRQYAYDLTMGALNDLAITGNQVRQYAFDLVNSVGSAIERDLATAIDGVISRLLNLQEWTTQSIRAAYDAVFANLGNQVSQELGGIWDGIATPAEQAVQGIAAEYPDIAASLRNIPLTVPADIVGALTAVGAITIPLSTYVERCGIPMCKSLSGFGNELQALLGLVGDGALLAFIIEAATHPETAADDTQAIAMDIINPVVDAVKAIVG